MVLDLGDPLVHLTDTQKKTLCQNAVNRGEQIPHECHKFDLVHVHADNPRDYVRKLTQEEADCYWTTYPEVGLTYQNLGLPLSKETASYSWNDEANKGNFRNVICRDASGNYNWKLTQQETQCYWMNYPQAGLQLQQEGQDLSQRSASFSFNYNANILGNEPRNLVCGLMFRDPTQMQTPNQNQSLIILL